MQESTPPNVWDKTAPGRKLLNGASGFVVWSTDDGDPSAFANLPPDTKIIASHIAQILYVTSEMIRTTAQKLDIPPADFTKAIDEAVADLSRRKKAHSDTRPHNSASHYIRDPVPLPLPADPNEALAKIREVIVETAPSQLSAGHFCNSIHLFFEDRTSTIVPFSGDLDDPSTRALVKGCISESKHRLLMVAIAIEVWTAEVSGPLADFRTPVSERPDRGEALFHQFVWRDLDNSLLTSAYIHPFTRTPDNEPSFLPMKSDSDPDFERMSSRHESWVRSLFSIPRETDQ